ncbi:ATPase family AAA domain-containing protein 5 [Hondaea fermentalgiana]|uniref:ATPase family AAA domain-containing protein 5 n=1 Tax=Hondaea fermentalgiana TaxID=2315210 RepID=A0A2R5GQW3_9STRA|nr:ATPase family AAA domain-containing protein 5 [Hondaea fermentalgiana]|eukprot:GBG33240.1 ATPase family AAA domain-containing protein 5 [Hondaea fermentalgiana]
MDGPGDTVSATTPAAIAEDSFHALVKLVDHDVRGNLTFEGFVKLYKLDYEEQGQAMGDLNVWNDLSKFGFDTNLVHNGQFPPRAQKHPNAFALLGKPAASTAANNSEKAKSLATSAKAAKSPRHKLVKSAKHFSTNAKQGKDALTLIMKAVHTESAVNSNHELAVASEAPVPPSRADAASPEVIDITAVVDTSHTGPVSVRVHTLSLPSDAKPDDLIAELKVRGLMAHLGDLRLETLREFAQLRLGSEDDKTWESLYRPAYAKILFENTETARGLREWLETWVKVLQPGEDANFEGAADNSRSSWHSGSFWDGNWDDLDEDALDGPAVSSAPVHVVVGGTGLGKSNIAHYLADQFEFLVTEVHAGTVRSAVQLKAAIGEATQSCAISKSRRLNKALILIDEVDIVFEDDKQFYAGIKALVNNARCPILFTCNRVPTEFLRMFPDRVIEHRMGPGAPGPILEALRYTCIVQGIEVSDAQLLKLLGFCKGKFSQTLHQLQFRCAIPVRRRQLAPIGSPQRSTPGVIDITTPKRSSSSSIGHDDEVEEVETLTTVVETNLFPQPLGLRDAREAAQDDQWNLDTASQVLQSALQAALASPCSKSQCRFHLGSVPEDPIVEGLEPPLGALRGGTKVHVYGTHLAHPCASHVSVDIDGCECEVLTVSEHLIVMRTPPMRTYNALVDNAHSGNRSSEERPTREPGGSEEDSSPSSDSDFEETRTRRPSRLRRGRKKTHVPKRRRVVASLSGATHEVDAIEDSDDDDNDPLGATQTQSPEDQAAEARMKAPQQRKLRPFDKLVHSRLWPVDLHVTVRLPQMILATSRGRAERQNNGLFEYSRFVDPSQTQLSGQLQESDAQPVVPSQEEKPYASLACEWNGTMEELCALADWGSWCDVLQTPPGNPAALRGWPVQEDFRYEDASFDDDLRNVDAAQANIVANFECVGARVFSRGRLVDAGAANLTNRALTQRRVSFMYSARGCAEAALTSFGLGAARGLGLANTRRVQHAVLDEVGCLTRIAWLEEGRKAVDTSRRGFRHYMDNRGLSEAKGPAHEHLGNFWLWNREEN